MKVNLAWLADLTDLSVDKQKLLEAINTQLGEVETSEDLAAKYADVLIVEVVKIKTHPQADRLKVCLINDSQAIKAVERDEQGLIEVVCGASNLRQGMFACWLPPTAKLPCDFAKAQAPSLEALEIRGVKSWGMLASALELDLGNDDQGILELRADCQVGAGYPIVKPNRQLVGQKLARVYGLETTILDIDNKMFTHRPDCFGLIGVAREIAAITKSVFKPPVWYTPLESKPSLEADQSLALEIKTPELAECFRALIIKDLQVRPADLSLQFRLASVGIKPVNNIVDWSNYMMYLTGQPTHAFDYDKLVGLSQNPKPPKLIVRLSQAGESLQLLNGKQLKFDQPALVIATDQQPVALAGIMGGSETEVDLNTKTIVLECANFNMYQLWRTSMHYGVFSEAATRFSKGQSLAQIPTVAQATAEMMTASATGQLQSTIYESKPIGQTSKATVTVHVDFINQRLGSNLTFEEIVELLEKVEFEVILKTEQLLEVKPPFWRMDIGIAEDIVEEIGRLNGGYQSLKPQLPLRPLQAIEIDKLLKLKTRIRRCLAARGANETIGYSFVSKAQLKANGQDESLSFQLLNPLNPQLEVYRQSLTPSLIQLAATNQRQGYKEFALFEIGCAHQKRADWLDQEALPLDLQRTALICAQSSLNDQAFYLARRYLDLIARDFQLRFDYQVFPDKHDLDASLIASFELKRSALIKVGEFDLGIIGCLKSNQALAAWEIKTDVLLQAIQKPDSSLAYQPVSRYPGSVQDLTLKTALTTNYGQFEKLFNQIVETYRRQRWQITWELKSIYQPPANPNLKHLTSRWHLTHLDKTASKTEVLKIMAAVVKLASQVDKSVEQVV